MTDDPDFVKLRKRLRAPEGVYATRLHAKLAVDAAQAAYAIENLTAERDEARRQWGECDGGFHTLENELAAERAELEIQRDSKISAVNQMLAAELALVVERSNREFTEQALSAMQADRDRWLERARVMQEHAAIVAEQPATKEQIEQFEIGLGAIFTPLVAYNLGRKSAGGDIRRSAALSAAPAGAAASREGDGEVGAGRSAP